ncbi:MAG: bifunctional demethylmenaquinone methyltransferase/2-methoxy-6-polyprenyl-1,4-benzoquinol methylase UbiE [Bacteroidota bacterium]|nr:bifunctional demethylmenaquinone methyltransferase/2-methoxy-6-polyprenyl-1,4-benzoquinol methylase UbiE [Bacteroidota bacterium]MDP4289782.1 bifunctional demethylmenaquinone methyltransferase/2-methoxy-6-polyprenyl-1,4-benzoquinol methylase UbiE [Bacteroidota bacterium]
MAEGKKEQVRSMFNKIAWRYDLLNHLLSLNIDKIWRKKLVKMLSAKRPDSILDVATGTGDLAITASKIKPREIIGIDIAEEMLEIGRKKIADKGLQNIITLQTADSENLPFPAERFEATMVAFGVRNFENLELGLTEMHRVLKKKGTLYVLEFSIPTNKLFRPLYFFYFKNILPLIGKIVSQDTAAYTYLPDSVSAFPSGPSFIERLEKSGFTKCTQRPLTFGIATIYTGEK